MIEMTHRDTGASLGKTLYLRARVSHRRGKAAENVEVLAASLWSEDDSGHREPAPGFLPLNLTWSHVGGATIRIPRKLFRHCDVGHFANVNGETTLFLDTIAQPNPVAGGDLPTVRWPGRYVLELQLSGDNVKTISRRWRIEFRPAWSDDEASMLERIRVERV